MILVTLQEESGKAPYFLSEFYDTMKVTIPWEVVGGLSVAANNQDKEWVEISLPDILISDFHPPESCIIDCGVYEQCDSNCMLHVMGSKQAGGW